MSYALNPSVEVIATPPIAEARSWLNPAAFDSDTPLIDLSQAVPSYPPPAEVNAQLKSALDETSTAFYTDICGITPLRDRLAGHMTRAGGDVVGDDVLITAGCNQAFCIAMQALAGRGDNVVVPLPWYFNHRMWLDSLGIETSPVPFNAGSGVPDLDAIRRAIDDRTRAIVLVTPNNPTGAVYSNEYLHAVNAIAIEAGIALVVDETYRDFIHDGSDAEPDPHDLFKLDDWRSSIVQLYSFSKVFSLTGYRVGSIIAGPQMLESCEKIMDCIAICAAAISQQAALAGLETGDAFRRDNRKLMASRLSAIREAFAPDDLDWELVTSGAYFGYLKHPFGDAVDSFSVARRLAQQYNLLTLPGAMFGDGQDEYLRIAFANVEADQFPDVVARLRDASSNWKNNS